MMPDTIFTKLIRGDLPCHKIYEDELVFAFLDIGPLSRGHALVIPKEPAETLDALSPESAAAIGRVLPRICQVVVDVSGAKAYNVLQNNGPLAHQAVFHVHFHVIPRFEDGSGLRIDWKPGKLDPELGAELAAEMASRLAD